MNRVIELKFEIIEIAKNEISALKRAIIANEGNCKLGKGELSCILLSLNSDIDIIFTDDKAACKYIKQNLNIKISGTLGLLKMMYDDGYLSKEKIVSISEKMKNEGYWISDKLYSDFIENL